MLVDAGDECPLQVSNYRGRSGILGFVSRAAEDGCMVPKQKSPRWKWDREKA